MKRSLEETARRFDELAEHYDRNADEWLRKAQETCVRLLDLRADDVVLDAGCATGTITAMIAPKVKRVIGIDISEAMLDQATAKLERFNNVAVGRGSFQRLDECFSLQEEGLTKIVSCYAMRHLDPQEKRVAIDNLASLLPLGAKIVIGDIMFFEDPEPHIDLFDPNLEEPCTVKDLLALFRLAGCIPKVHQIHPVVGVIEAEVGER